MNIKDLYRRVSFCEPMQQNEFISYLNDTIDYLQARYGTIFVSEDGCRIEKINAIDNDVPLRPEYISAVFANIIYLKTGNTDRKVDAVATAEFAYRTAWREAVSGKRLNEEVW